MLRLFEGGEPATADLIGAIEGDLALAIAVMRLANQLDAANRGRIETAVQAVEVLSRGGAVIASARTYDFFERTAVWQDIPSASGCTVSRLSGPRSGSRPRSTSRRATG